MENLKDFILSELRKSNIKMKASSKEIVICCPWHDDRNPSYHIVLNHKTLPPGVGNCFSCGASGNWNKLADKLGLKKITRADVAETDPFFSLAGFFDIDPTENILKLPAGIKKWSYGPWRGLPEKLLQQVEAYKWWDKINEVDRILFPIYNFGELKGYVGARLDNKTNPKYRNSSGPFAQTTWFGLDYPRVSSGAKKIWNSYNEAVAITEGPYDCLMCLYNKIPAISLLGTKNWSDVKRGSLVGSSIKNVVLFLDGDDSGVKCAETIREQIIKDMHVKTYQLPCGKNLDPGNCGEEHYTNVRNILKSFSIYRSV